MSSKRAETVFYQVLRLQSEILNLGLWSRIILCRGDLSWALPPVSSIPAFYPLDASSNTPQAVTTKMPLNIAKCSRGAKSPLAENYNPRARHRAEADQHHIGTQLSQILLWGMAHLCVYGQAEVPERDRNK